MNARHISWWQSQKNKISVWGLIIFLIQAEYVIIKYANKVDRLEVESQENIAGHKAFMNCFFELKVNPYKYLSEGNGISNDNNKDAKHEDLLTIK